MDVAVTVMVAERDVLPVGLNVTAILQAAPGVSVPRQATFEALKYEAPLPAKEMLPNVSGAVPVFDAVTGKVTGPP